MTVYKSGAFLQQCFSVHPLSLNVKLVALPGTIGIICSNCRMRHRLTLHHTAGQSPVNTEPTDPDIRLLERCFSGHPDELRISLVHVEHQGVEFRCRPCRRSFVVKVGLFETHQA
jgi:hypothetical protein